jgi:hypothetical protein
MELAEKSAADNDLSNWIMFPEPPGAAWIKMSMLILSHAANDELSSLVIHASLEWAFSGNSIRGIFETGACFLTAERK